MVLTNTKKSTFDEDARLPPISHHSNQSFRCPMNIQQHIQSIRVLCYKCLDSTHGRQRD